MDADVKKDLVERIEKALESIRPHLITDGGDIEFVELTDDMEVKVKWLGNCKTCSLSQMTLKSGVEHAIKSCINDITKVTSVDLEEQLHES